MYLMALYKTFSQLIIYMSLKKIIEIENKNYKKGKILKEKMDIVLNPILVVVMAWCMF